MAGKLACGLEPATYVSAGPGVRRNLLSRAQTVISDPNPLKRMPRSEENRTSTAGWSRRLDVRLAGGALLLAAAAGLGFGVGRDRSGSSARSPSSAHAPGAGATNVSVAGAAEGAAAEGAGTPRTSSADAAGRSGTVRASETDAGETAATAGVTGKGIVPAPAPPRALPTDPSPLVASPVAERVPKPDAVRGIYVGSWSAGSARRLRELVALADDTEINAFVIDVKDATGEVSYASQVPLAREIGATARVRIGDIRRVLGLLRSHGIYPIARIVAFKDPLLAAARPEWAIANEDGSVWQDQHGVRWVDAFDRHVWDYDIELAREAVALGFSEVQWDYVRFPDVPSSYMDTVPAVYPARSGREKAEGIRAFLSYSRDRLAEYDVPVTADVFGITTSAHRDYGIGQLWEKMSDVTDVLLPMVYPSHYPHGTWDYDNPNAAPYQIVRHAVGDGVERSKEIEGAAAIRPWLQAFSMGQPDYGPRQIRAQIDAVYDAGVREWILWHAAVRYPIEALADSEGNEPWFAGLGEQLYPPSDTVAPVRDSVVRTPVR